MVKTVDLVNGRILIIGIIFLALFDNSSFEESPRFVNQQIIDHEEDDSIINRGGDPQELKEFCKDVLEVYKILPEIFSASYRSDGKILDATLWLKNSNIDKLSSLIGNPVYTTLMVEKTDMDKLSSLDIIEQKINSDNETVLVQTNSSGKDLSSSMALIGKPIIPNENSLLENITEINVIYEIIIDIISTYDKGSDYSLVIEWNNKTGKWYEQIKEIASPSDKEKILRTLPFSFSNDQNVTEHEYVNLTSDLEQLGSPEDYNVVARTYSVFHTTGGLSCSAMDLIDQITIPPPRFDIHLEPPRLELQTGQKGEVNIKINSSANLDSRIHLPKIIKDDQVEMKFFPYEILVPAKGNGGSTMFVTSVGDASDEIYNITLQAKFPQKFKSALLNVTDYSNETSIPLNIFPQIIVVEPPTLLEQMGTLFDNSSHWLQNFAAYITTIGTISTAIFALVAYLRKKHMIKKIEVEKSYEKINQNEKDTKQENRDSLGNIFKYNK